MRYFILTGLITFFAVCAVSAARAGDMAVKMNERIDFLFGKKASRRYEPFIRAFQAAVRQNDPVTVSRFILYPVVVRLKGREIRLGAARDFIRYYPEILTRQMRATVACQSYETLFANWQGVMFGHGAVWISEVFPDAGSNRTVLKVTAINGDGVFKDQEIHPAGCR